MSETPRHTPGPWVAKTGGMDAKVVCPDGRSFDCGDIVYHPENRANAHLIAAAPELLEVLRAFVGHFDGNNLAVGDWPLMDQARAVIAKAEGQ